MEDCTVEKTLRFSSSFSRRLYACRLGGAQSPSATVSLELKRVYLLQPHRTNYQLFFLLLSFNCSYHFFDFILLPTHSNANRSALAEFDGCSRPCGDGFNGGPKSPLATTALFPRAPRWRHRRKRPSLPASSYFITQRTVW
jgi:hypothetical protein